MKNLIFQSQENQRFSVQQNMVLLALDLGDKSS